MKLFTIIFTCALCLAVSPATNAGLNHQDTGPAVKTADYLKLRFVKADYAGCGCEFSSASELKKRSPRFLFAADEEEQRGWINVEGWDRALALIHSTNPKKREKVGDVSTRIYAGDGIKVSATYIATKVCRVTDKDCKGADYLGTFTITKGEDKRTIRLRGRCAC